MKRNSLSTRLFVSSAIWTLIVLPVVGIIQVSLYRDDVENDFDRRLNIYLENLIAITLPDTDTGIDIVPPPTNQVEPAFTTPGSGWYWEIRSPDNSLLSFKSESLASESLTLPSEAGVGPDESGNRIANHLAPDGLPVRILEREITIDGGDQQRRYIYAVAGDALLDIDDVIDEFIARITIAFSIFGAGLLIATFFQVRYGLRPLREISNKLAAIRSGQASKLEGDPPQEIQPLQEELNALIQSNQAIIERARTHVGNLAHALKTPLSVITNEAREHDDPFAKKITGQAELMREYITHHLTRAQVAARVSVVGGITDVNETVTSLTKALSRIYTEKNLNFMIECPQNAKFRGEKQDLQEMVGNLLDNACKWAEEQICVQVKIANSKQSNGAILTVLVDDDGPGLTPSELEAVVKRGKRLDETKPGSGLGLSIVADLSEMYNGSFVLLQAPTGGVRAKLILPST